MCNQKPPIKSPRPDSFPGEIHETFKEELIAVLLKLSKKSRSELILQGQHYPGTKTRR